MPLDADALFERRRLKRRLSLWRVLAVAALIAAGVAIFAGEVDLRAGTHIFDRPHVARIFIDEVIIEDRDRQELLERLVDNDNVRALIVHVNSPGGTTFGSEEIYVALRQIAARRPVVAVIGTIGASGGYITAIAADRIFARESSITGSVGVLFQTTEISTLMDKLGVKAEAITSGPLKAEPSPFKPMSEEARQATQDMVNETYRWFIGLVTDRRKLDQRQVAAISSGGVYIGRVAIDLGLIDELGGEKEARAWLSTGRDIDADLPTRTVDWRQPKESWTDLITGSVARAFGKAVLSERLSLDGLISLWHPHR